MFYLDLDGLILVCFECLLVGFVIRQKERVAMSNATDLLKSIILNDNNALEHASDKDEGGPEDGDEDK